MPIYMDRHDVSSTVTAENVAQLHQADLKIQNQFGCRGLTYWFDDKRKTAFCLIEAPEVNAILKMHNQAHGQVPNSIIEVETSIVESFLGRIEDPQKAQDTGLNIINDPAFRTIMVISSIKSKLGKSNSLKLKTRLRDFNKAIIKILNLYDGKSVRQTDDNYLISFKSVTNSVHAAKEFHLLNKEFNKKNNKDKYKLKIGISAGIPVTKKQSIFEDTIKLAERMCDIVKGDIIVSKEVKDLYKSENENTFINGKNISTLTQANEIFITHLMDYTDENWRDVNLKVDHFTKPVGCSKSQFYRKMILLTGKSPNSYIKEYRLKKALKLLKKNESNISEVAFDTGFSSPSYFTKCFKQQFGLLPVIYMNSLQ